MPRRNSLTRRLLHHLLLISLARCLLTVLGRGRAWDEWDDRGETEPQPASSKRSFQRRFVRRNVVQPPLLRRPRALRGRGQRSEVDARCRRGDCRSPRRPRPVRPARPAPRARPGLPDRQLQDGPGRLGRTHPRRRPRPPSGGRTGVDRAADHGAHLSVRRRRRRCPRRLGCVRPSGRPISTTHVARPGAKRTGPRSRTSRQALEAGEGSGARPR